MEGSGRPTKTFGLSRPMDVFEKLDFDLKRLRSSRNSSDVKFACLDLAIWSYHMIDWVLVTVSEVRHNQLTGYSRYHSKAINGFVERQSIRLGTLGFCQQMANTGKHRVLTHKPDDPSFETNHTVMIEWGADANGSRQIQNMYPTAYLKDTATGQKIDAKEFFALALEQWANFLKAENLYDWEYDVDPPEYEPDDDGDGSAG